MADWWISKNGDNAWSGQDDQNPYATFAHVNAQMSAGDTCWILDDVLSHETNDWINSPPPSGTSWENTTKYRGVPVSQGGSSIAGMRADPTWPALTVRLCRLPDGAAYLEFKDLLADGKANIVGGDTFGSNDAFHLGAGSHHLRFTRVHTLDTPGHGIQQGQSNPVELLWCTFERANSLTAHASQSSNDRVEGVYVNRGPIWFYGCQFIDCSGDAFNAHYNNGALITGVKCERSLIKGCGFGYTHDWGTGTETRGNGNGIILWDDELSGTIVRNCIFWNNRRGLLIGGGSDGNFIHNNTFYLTDLEGILVASGCGNNDLRNNILLGTGGTPLVDAGFNNIVTPNLTSGDPATIFMDHLNGNFKLQEGASAARGMADDLSSVFTDDYDGKTRVAWDHGAFEYQAALNKAATRKRHFLISRPPAFVGSQ